jgi:hypothetical protein
VLGAWIISGVAKEMRSTARLLGQLELAASRYAGSVHIPECLPSTSYSTSSSCAAAWSNSNSTSSSSGSGSSSMGMQQQRGSSTQAAAASMQQPATSLQQPNIMDIEYTRRLQEMLAYDAARHAAAAAEAAAQPRQRRRINIADVPKFQLPASSKQPASPPNQPAVDWQQIVEHVRRTGQMVSGEQMLTDTFRWGRFQ